MARSVTPRRRAPASEVTRPPSNSATSSRPPALPNAIPVALQCVGIGECPLSGLPLVLAKPVLPAQRPRCTTPRERCALAPAETQGCIVGATPAHGLSCSRLICRKARMLSARVQPASRIFTLRPSRDRASGFEPEGCRFEPCPRAPKDQRISPRGPYLLAGDNLSQ